MAILQIDDDFVRVYSNLYAADAAEFTPKAWALEVELFGPIHAAVRSQGFLTRSQLKKVAEWKSPRQRSRIASNTDESVRRVSRVALAPEGDERASALASLNGVMEPMASAISLCGTLHASLFTTTGRERHSRAWGNSWGWKGR